MHLEVDQSGKIEQTNYDTVSAFSDRGRTRRTVFIKATEKRKLIKTLRDQGRKGTWFYPRIYAACLYILLKPILKKATKIWIDDEYTGKQKIIKSIIIDLAKQDGIKLDWDQIEFKLVGRKSKAHILAWNTLHGDIDPDKKISAHDVLEL